MKRHPAVSEFFASRLGGRVQKIAVNAGLGCPNRDGTISRTGCTYCNNAAFNPSYAHLSDGSISSQLEQGMKFNAGKSAPAGYLAYFQSYSNTHGNTPKLISLYEEALAFDPSIKGLVIATRPDCLRDDLLDYFGERFGNAGAGSRKGPAGGAFAGTEAGDGKPFLLVELGIESTIDATLERINRGHTFAQAEDAVRRLAGRGIPVGAHLILGLPGESREQMLSHADRISALPISTLKLHQLQIIKGTPLAHEWESDPSGFNLFSAMEYAALLCEFLGRLREDIALDRFVSESPLDMVLAPKWGLKPSEFLKLI